MNESHEKTRLTNLGLKYRLEFLEFGGNLRRAVEGRRVSFMLLESSDGGTEGHQGDRLNE